MLSDRTDPGHVVLVEIYRDEAAAAAHKETAHYQRWRDTVATMMAQASAGHPLRQHLAR